MNGVNSEDIPPKTDSSSTVVYQHYILSNTIKNIYSIKLSIQLWFSIFVSERAKET